MHVFLCCVSVSRDPSKLLVSQRINLNKVLSKRHGTEGASFDSIMCLDLLNNET